MARLLVACPAQLDVREILTKLTEAAGYPVAHRCGARFKAMYVSLHRAVPGRRRTKARFGPANPYPGRAAVCHDLYL